MTQVNTSENYQQASLKTADNLQAIASAEGVHQLSHLTLPEIAQISSEIARVVPAGNVPGIVLSGLVRLDGREIPQIETGKNIGLLFRGARQMLDKAVYGAFFAGPAAVLYGYQKLLQLAGRTTEKAFPEGTWQFYLGFALREDNARHTNETIGFHRALTQYNLPLDDAATLASWVMGCAYFLHQLPQLLTNEWYERVATKILADVAIEAGLPNASVLRDLFGKWEAQRPYQRGIEAGADDYPTYRRRVFDKFLKSALITLPATVSESYHARLNDAQVKRLPAYLTQMSWLSYLEPDNNQETRTAYPPEQASIGLIWQGRYYLIPFHDALDPTKVHSTILGIMTTIATQPPAELDELLVTLHRTEHSDLRAALPKPIQSELEAVRRAPILINWDVRDEKQSLVQIRQTKRGIGDHAITIMRTSDSIVFDQSHIFFDGVWGASVAEILTHESISWALYFAQTPTPHPSPAPYSPSLPADDINRQKIQSAQIPAETGAENIIVHLGAIMALRKLLKQRNDIAQVTVNDILLLYRGLHAQNYNPSSRLQVAVDLLQRDSQPEIQRAHRAIISEFTRLKGKNPALLIPIDASRHDPAERVFPTTFRNPLTDFHEQHQLCVQTLQAYRHEAKGTRGATFKAFYDAQIYYLRLIAGFGELLTQYRNVALMGQSTSIASIRFLGNLPAALQKLLDSIPSRFDVLNEIIKGEEVFSNMGKVAKGSSLRRFITAKDDNEQKTLAWGVLTDDQNIIHISLRDFRPHVAVLESLNMGHLAQFIAQDYLDSYADGLNQYVLELRDIVLASRETQLDKTE